MRPYGEMFREIIHSNKHPQLTAYRIASQDFCRQFRTEFAAVSKSWPNVSTDYSSQTLMRVV